MDKQQLINAISQYIQEISQRILAFSPNTKSGFKTMAVALKDKIHKSDNLKNSHIKFFAALKLLHHVISNQPLNLDAKEQPLLNAAINENGSNLNKLFIQYNEYLKTPFAADTKVSSINNDEKIKTELKKTISTVIKHLIQNNKFIEYVSANIDKLAGLFGVVFLVELHNSPVIPPQLGTFYYSTDTLDRMSQRLDAHAKSTSEFTKKMQNFLNQGNHSAAIWNEINNIETLQRLIPLMNKSYVEINMTKILNLVKTINDFFAIYPLLSAHFPSGIPWSLEFTSRCFDPEGINLNLNVLVSDTINMRPVDVENLINSPRAALLAAAQLVKTIDDFQRLAVIHPWMLFNIVNDKTAAINLFNELFVNNVDKLIYFMNFRSTNQPHSIRQESIIFTFIKHPEIFNTLLERITPQQVETIINYPEQPELHQLIIGILRAKKLPVVANQPHSAAKTLQDDKQLTTADLKEAKNVDLYVGFLADAHVAERWFKHFFEKNMKALIDILVDPKNERRILVAMIKHPAVLEIAITAIDTANVARLLRAEDLATIRLVYALVSRPDKMLAFVQHDFPTAEKFIEFSKKMYSVHIRTLLNHEIILAHIAGLFKTMQPLLAFRAVTLSHIHPVYYIAEWLLRTRQQVIVDTNNDQQLTEFFEQFHGYGRVLKLDVRVITALSEAKLLPPLIDLISTYLLGDYSSNPVPTVRHTLISNMTATARPLPVPSNGVAQVAMKTALSISLIADNQLGDTKDAPTPTAKP